jgi:hypothetical protein
MSDENIVISVQDRVPDTIAPKLLDMETNALRAMDAFTRMQQAINNVNAGAINRVANQVKANQTQFQAATTVLSSFGQMNTRVARQVDALTVSILKQTTAVTAHTTALSGTQALYAGASAAASGLRTSTSGVSNTLRDATGAVTGFGSGTRTATGSLALLSGNMQGGRRLAGAFLAQVLGLGPALAVAFPVIAAIAFTVVIAQVIAKFVEAVLKANEMSGAIKTAFDTLNRQAATALDSQTRVNDRLQDSINKLEHKPTNLIKAAIDDALKSADELSAKLTEDLGKIGQIVAQNSNNSFGGFLTRAFTGQAATSGTADEVDDANARIKQVQQAQDALVRAAAGTGDASKLKDATANALANVNRQIDEEVNKLKASYNNLTETQKLYQGTLADNSSLELQAQHAIANVVLGREDQSANIQTINGTIKALQTLKGTYDELYKTPGLENKKDDLENKLRGESDASKEARKQMKAYEDELKNLEATSQGTGPNGLFTPQDEVNFFKAKAALPTTLPANQPILRDKEAEPQQRVNEAITSQTDALNKLQLQYDGIIAKSTLYGEALKEATTEARINAEIEQIRSAALKNGIAPNEARIAQLRATGRTAADAEISLAAMEKVYKDIDGPIDTFVHSQDALLQLLLDGALTLDQYNVRTAQLAKEYDEATVPLVKFNEALKEQKAIQDLAGPQKQGAENLFRVQEQAQQKGLIVTPEQQQQVLQAPVDNATAINAQKELEQIYAETAEKQALLLVGQTAYNTALHTGVINSSQYAQGLRNVYTQQAELNLSMGVASTTLKDVFVAALGDMTKSYTTFFAGFSKAIGQLGNTLISGFGDAVARSITQAKNFGEALKDLARTAIQQLLSAIIQLIIKLTLMKALESVLGFAGGGAVGSAAHFAQGGKVQRAYADGGSIFGAGSGTSDSIPAWVSNGEFVMKASAVKRIGLPTLAAMNEGRVGQSASSSAGSPAVGSSHMKINVVHDGSTAIQIVQGATHDEVNVIAKSAAKQVLQNDGPGMMGREVQNVNSPISKALTHQTYTTRRR